MKCLDKDFLRVNPLSIGTLRKLSLKTNHQGDIDIYFEKQKLLVESVFVSRIFRTDCMIRGMDNILYPNLFRNNANDFLSSVVYALSDRKWFPATYSAILRSDSKLNMYSEATKCGISVPYTEVSYSRMRGRVIRKALPYPFTVSNKKSSREEKTVTLYTSTDKNDSNLGMAWVWQKYVKPTYQVRSVFVETKNWAVATKVSPADFHFDLREVSDTGIKTEWYSYQLPEEILFNIRKLMRRLDIKYCCPEMLVDKKGAHYLIDLNPCGDFWGFFSRKITAEIAHAIAQRL